MTPRDKLIENIIDVVHATKDAPEHQRYPHLVKLLEATLKTHYAIGKWVPVSERLPEFHKGRWAGVLRNDDDAVYFGRFHYKEMMPGYEWLELDMPEVES